MTCRTLIRRSLRFHGCSLECDDLASLSVGGLPPSNGLAQAHRVSRTRQMIHRAAGRGTAWATSRLSGHSSVEPPHSKAGRRIRP